MSEESSQSMLDEARARLGAYTEPYMGTDLASAKCISGLDLDGDTLRLRLSLGFPAAGYHEALAGDLRRLIGDLPGAGRVEVTIDTKITPHTVQKGVKRLPAVKNIIAIGSGKGGVGKSTTATNLALALQQEGAAVGVLDADIYGPSQPRMLGCPGRPDTTDGKTLKPMMSYNIQAMSIGNLIEEDTPMIWRGPMVTSALQQLLNDTEWRDLDYLIVDLPPGTGDIQLTLCQSIPVSGAIIVTTPQDIALLDARKALKMFEKVDVAVLGIVENMSTHVCSNCGHEEAIFGTGGGQAMATQYNVELLGQLPLDLGIREGVDSGRPTVALQPDSAAARTYHEIARKSTARLALRGKDYSGRFPEIVIENS